MLGRRILSSAVRRPVLGNHQSFVAGAVARRCYAKAAAPEPKLHPLSEPIPGELDPRFGDMPQWTVPEVNRQNLTEVPVEPYYDQQGRRYYGEPLSEQDEALSVFAIDVHNHVTVPVALKWFFGFAAAFTGMCYLIIYSWPGKIAVPRTFPYNGLERELTKNYPARKDSVQEDAIE